ncbi:MAG: hypothetical protein GEU26_01735 [Nitrososphaeraceae archaeon]|nr:hypothetical protein [Nitrososphaeraceae archaeon]
MVGELFLGLLSIGIAVGASVSALILEMRKSRGKMDNLLGFLTNSTLSHADERIALIYAMADEVQYWKSTNTDIKLKTSRIVSDITAVARIHNNMTFEQWRELQKAIDALVENMKQAKYDTSEIEYTRRALR